MFYIINSNLYFKLIFDKNTNNWTHGCRCFEFKSIRNNIFSNLIKIKTGKTYPEDNIITAKYCVASKIRLHLSVLLLIVYLILRSFF